VDKGVDNPAPRFITLFPRGAVQRSETTSQVSITERDVEVRFQKRAHNPLLLAAGFAQTAVPVPWLGNKRLRFMFG
jgi:hypothetical protein